MRNSTCPAVRLSGVRGKHLLIALSGGADSVALLCLAAEQAGAMDIRLTCAHMDHGIRAESPEDAAFCEDLCRKMGIPLRIVQVDIPNIAKTSGEGIETCARRVRYEWLRRVKDEISADHIVLAHHMDDQAETVLMHLFRGTGPEGISGMREFSGELFRPLLNIPKQALTDYLTAKGISWREDKTNLADDNPRNDLRLNAIPMIERSYPRACAAIARFSRAAEVENDFLSRLTDGFMNENLVTGPFGKLLKLPEGSETAIIRRAVRRICGPDLDHEKLIEIACMAESAKGKTDISAEMFAERGRLGLYFLPKRPIQIPETALSLCGMTEIDGFCQMEAISAAPVPVKDDPMRQVLRRCALEGAVIRTRRDGDRVRPLGCGEKLLSDYLTDKKIDRPLRDFIPLVASGSNILWAVGVGISSDAAIRAGSDDCVSLTCKPVFET